MRVLAALVLVDAAVGLLAGLFSVWLIAAMLIAAATWWQTRA